MPFSLRYAATVLPSILTRVSSSASWRHFLIAGAPSRVTALWLKSQVTSTELPLPRPTPVEIVSAFACAGVATASDAARATPAITSAPRVRTGLSLMGPPPSCMDAPSFGHANVRAMKGVCGSAYGANASVKGTCSANL